jgi:peptidyl-prolyl cis-trans isomerase D
MLNTFRRGGVIQVVMGGVIMMIIVAFALEARGPNTAGSFETECAVQVGGSCVNPRDFTAAFQLSVRPELTAKEIKRLGLRKMVLDGLVERELLLQEAGRLGISISSAEVDEELSLGRFRYSLPAERDGQLPMMTYLPVRHPETEQFNFEIYQRMVRNYARMSTKDFKAYQTDELIASRMRDLSKLGVRVSEAELLAAFESDSAKATVRVAQLDRAWFARFGTLLSDEAVHAYITAHMADIDRAFSAQEATYAENCPLVSEIVFAYPAAADEADEKQTRARAERVAAEAAKSPLAFGSLARVHSAAPSASYDGKRGCLLASESEETGQLVKAVESLSPGELSALVANARGLTLLRLEQRVPKERTGDVGRLSIARPLAVLEAASAQTLEFAKALTARVNGGQSMQDAVDQLARETLQKSPVASLAGARAAELSAAALEARERPQVDVSPSFSRGGVTSPVPNAVSPSGAKQLAFSLKNIGDVYPEPIETYDGVAVLQLKDTQPPRREDFEKNKAEYSNEFKSRAQSEALTAYIARLRKDHESEIRINERFLEVKAGSGDDS